MVDEERPTKKVVKKVVKKTVVVRPAQPGSTQVRTASVRSATRPTVSTPLGKLKAAAPRLRPSIRIPSPPRRPGAGLAAKARLIGSRVGDRASDASYATKEAFGRGADRVRSARLPHLSPMKGSAITGGIVGLLAVVLGWLSYELLSVTGRATSGGGWGALILVVVAFLTFTAGELLLEGFRIDHARVISATSVMLTLVLVLLFSPLLELAAGPGAWLLIPVLGTITFMLSCKVMYLAADDPTVRR